MKYRNFEISVNETGDFYAVINNIEVFKDTYKEITKEIDKYCKGIKKRIEVYVRCNEGTGYNKGVITSITNGKVRIAIGEEHAILAWRVMYKATVFNKAILDEISVEEKEIEVRESRVKELSSKLEAYGSSELEKEVYGEE